MMTNGNDIMDHLHDANVFIDDNLRNLTKKKKGKNVKTNEKTCRKEKNKSS